jgi:hypothetical protein
MLRVEAVDRTTKQRTYVSFFPDDTIQTVYQRIGAAVDVHPDRLFVLVQLKRPASYFKDDPRRWEALFSRLSIGSPGVLKTPFQVYQTEYRGPATSIAAPEELYGRDEWMGVPSQVADIYAPSSDTFTDHCILGVEEAKSYVLPLDYDSAVTTKLLATAFPIPQQGLLVSSLYQPASIVSFMYAAYSEAAEPVQSIYFPFYRSTTPPRMPDETVQLLQRSTKRLVDLLQLNAPEPSKVSILRLRCHIPWVGTQFGAVRTRFEQMFYGLTVSKSAPCISFFTSASETTRHKFYVEDVPSKSPWIDVSMWSQWWAATKPARNRPTLVLYRGKSATHFDRISVTSVDMVVSTYRPEGNTQTVDALRADIEEWLPELDSILPFIVQSDLAPQRWELQDMSVVVKYREKLEEFDLRRFNCITSLFDVADKEKATFRMLRTDRTMDGLSATEIKILQLLKNRPLIKPSEIATELDIPAETARRLYEQVDRRVDEDPDLLNKTFRGFPTIKLGTDTALIAFTNNMDNAIRYTNMLRYILSNPDTEDIDRVCPKRMEQVQSEVAVVSLENEEVAEDAADWADFLMKDAEEAEPEAAPVEEAEVVEEKIQLKPGKSTLYNYFNTRLQAFGPVTFDPKDSQYPKKCEQKHQPIILSDAQLQALQDTPYDPRAYADDTQLLQTEDPNGLIVCPEYWCMKDEIPLKGSQLVTEGGTQRCPKCKGKIRQSSKDNQNEFTVIQRDVKRDKPFVYPGFTSYKSPANDRPMPCCYKTPETKKIKKKDDKYYILGETKTPIPELRAATLPSEVIASLFLPETYALFGDDNKRIQSGMSGFFRVGMGRPAQTLPTLLGLNTTVPRPKDAPESVLKCSFVTTWTRMSNTHVASLTGFDAPLARIISGIDDAFESDELTLLQELEYAAAVLQTDVFRVYLKDRTLGCMFYAPVAKPRARGILVLQTGGDIDILAHVQRTQDAVEFKSNVFQAPFPPACYIELERLRTQSCSTKVPSYADAVNALRDIAPEEEHFVIVDPYDRGQALYVPGKVVLPFQATAVTSERKMQGYTDVQPASFAEVAEYLDKAKTHSPGYELKDTLLNVQKQRVEVLLKSGLRIPIQPEDVEEDSTTGEVITTTREIGERELTFGKPDADEKKVYSDVSYASEVFDFMLFQLSKDTRADFIELRQALQTPHPARDRVEPLLRRWFNTQTRFVNVSDEFEFVTKVRKACGTYNPEEPEPQEAEQEAEPEAVAEPEPEAAPPPPVKRKIRKDAPCEKGKVLNPQTKRCVSETGRIGRSLKKDEAAPPPCEDGKIRNPASGRCVKATGAIGKKLQKGGSREECEGSMCGWDGNTCRIKIKNTVRKEQLFNRLLSTLIANAKLRGMVLDGHSTPFFSTILYVELPHEVFLTDLDMR